MLLLVKLCRMSYITVKMNFVVFSLTKKHVVILFEAKECFWRIAVRFLVFIIILNL